MQSACEIRRPASSGQALYSYRYSQNCRVDTVVVWTWCLVKVVGTVGMI